MKKLIEGIVEFRKGLTEESRDLFAKLALGQKPDALFIGCSDSRVVPNLFASTDPGDLFMLRNVGNLVPPEPFSDQEISVSAALEFSVLTLNVSNIIVCGHSECGAMHAICEGIENLRSPHLRAWLQHGEESRNRVKGGLSLNTTLSEENQISQINVLQQMEHLLTYPFVRSRVKKKKLGIHGWWFDIGHADVYCYEKSVNQFVLIDETEAKLILERLG